MAKLSYGPATLHVLSSNGPSSIPLHFYSTSYSTTYRQDEGRGQSRGIPRQRGTSTGYIANFRPSIGYSAKLDEIDNPPMKKLLEDNYNTSTHRDFTKLKVPDAGEPLPSHVISYTSGFARNVPWTLPTRRQVCDVHIDTSLRLGASRPVYPRHQPTLHTFRPRDPVAMENSNYGPNAMSTECHTRFSKNTNANSDEVKRSCYSNIEGTGFTRAYTIEPVTFRPHENYTGELPGYMTWRPTGRSLMKNDFNSHTYMKGDEPLQSLTSRGNFSNGYVKGSKAESHIQPRTADMVGYTTLGQVHPNTQRRIEKGDPAEFSILTHPRQYASLTHCHYKGRQRPLSSKPRSLGREDIGVKEESGFARNNRPLVEPSDRDGGRFHTHYQSRYYDPSPKGIARQGHIAKGGGVQPSLEDGFTKSTLVHSYGPTIDASRDLRNMHPYTARSLMKRDPCFDDHTHDKKNHGWSSQSNSDKL